MSYKTVDISQIVSELLEVLVKNEVPVKALGNILNELKNTAYINTIIQSKNSNENKFKGEIKTDNNTEIKNIINVDMSTKGVDSIIEKVSQLRNLLLEVKETINSLNGLGLFK